MKSIELVDGIKSSVIGFGCAPILGSVEASRARRALEVALDCGITHFDLARSYGYGEAEQFVGKVLQGRRDSVVIASKFGIRANWKANLLKPAKPLIRIVRGRKKGTGAEKPQVAQQVVTTVADRFHDRIPFDKEHMIGSLERSLKALKTDRLDYFFVHEPPATLTHLDELCSAAEQLKAQGKILAWGLAYNRSQEKLHEAYLSCFDVLQFDNSPGANGYDELVSQRGASPNIFFSPFRGGTGEMRPTEKLRKLTNDFPRSVILCSMFSEQHIRQNTQVV